MRYLCESVIPKWFWFFRISAIISSYCVQKLIASSRWSNFTHKDTEKNRKIQNFKIVLNCRETDARVSSAKIRGLQSLKLENDGMSTGLKNLYQREWLLKHIFKFCLSLLLFVFFTDTKWSTSLKVAFDKIMSCLVSFGS